MLVCKPWFCDFTVATGRVPLTKKYEIESFGSIAATQKRRQATIANLILVALQSDLFFLPIFKQIIVKGG